MPGPAHGTGIVEEFEIAFAAANPELIERMRQAVEHADEVVDAYYREAQTYSGETVMPTEMRSYERARLAAAIAIINFLELPQEFLDRHLRQRPDVVGGAMAGETH